jgi:hypothetical protein
MTEASRLKNREYQEMAIRGLNPKMSCEECGFNKNIHALHIAHPMNYHASCGEPKHGTLLWVLVAKDPERYRRLGFRVLCANCNWDEELEKKRKNGYKNLMSKLSMTSKQKLRYGVLFAYSKGSMSCGACGDPNLDHLCLDEVDGGGSQEKLKLGNGKYGNGALTLWRMLRDCGYPEIPRRQVLCRNCNGIKAFENKEQRM